MLLAGRKRQLVNWNFGRVPWDRGFIYTTNSQLQSAIPIPTILSLHCIHIHILRRLKGFSLVRFIFLWLCLKLIGRNYPVCSNVL